MGMKSIFIEAGWPTGDSNYNWGKGFHNRTVTEALLDRMNDTFGYRLDLRKIANCKQLSDESVVDNLTRMIKSTKTTAGYLTHSLMIMVLLL